MIPPTRKTRRPDTKKIHVSEIQLGMYVSKLDRDWLETPFLMQGFLIESQEDIDLLIELCEHVWIDITFEEWTRPSHAKQSRSSKPTYTIRYVNKIPQTDEHKKALGIYKQAKQTTKSFLDTVRLTGEVDTQQIKETVDQCVLSVLKNSDALMWMTRMRGEDEHTAEHCLSVCILAITFGRHLRMGEVDLRKLGMCGITHDIGHSRIEPRLLRKQEGFTEKEQRILEAHTVYGRNILMACHGLSSSAIDVAYSHHERIDGTGYPRQLKGSAIPKMARIISIVDAYDELIAHRNPDQSISSTEALKYLYKERGKHFDEKITLDFIRAIGLYPPGSIVELVNGKVGLVLETNYRHRHLPKVFIALNEKKMFGREAVVDLEMVEKGRLDKGHLIKYAHKDGAFGIYLQNYKDKGVIFG